MQNNLLARLYSFHHAQRFLWLKSQIAQLRRNRVSIIELGCGNARSLDYIPTVVDRYLGFDAGMRSGTVNGKPVGFQAALERFAHDKTVSLQRSVHPSDLHAVQEKFDLAIVMETFEYLGTTNLESYVSAIADKLHLDGVLLATMPNERGLPLLTKTVGAKLSGIGRSTYTAAEFLNAVLGRMAHVPRMERGRKGFDYRAIARLVQRHFRYVRLVSIASLRLPLAFSPNIGLIASQRPVHPPRSQQKSSPSGNPSTAVL